MAHRRELVWPKPIFAQIQARPSTGLTPPAEGDKNNEFEKIDSKKNGTSTAEGVEEMPKKKKATRGRRGGKQQKAKDAAAAEERAKRMSDQIAEIISAAAASKSQPASASRTSLHPNIHALADFSYQNDGGGKEKTYRRAQCDQRMGGTRSPVQLK